MRTDLEPLRAVLPLQTLCEKHGLVFKPQAGNMVARCPFHDSGRSSFTIHAGDPNRAWCYGCDWGGGIIDFHAECRGLSTEGRDFLTLVDELHAIAGLTVPKGDIPLSRPKPSPLPSILEREPPVLPELSPLSDHCLRELSGVRGYSVEGLREAMRRGFLHYADWPLDKEGRTTSGSCASWCLTDSSRRVAQFRRLDGRAYFATPERDGIKAWSTSGARWLVGCQDVTPETELVLLVEGGADFLAAWTLIAAHAAGLSPVPSLAVCCVFGASMSIAPECRALLTGKRVRIIMDVDAPRSMKRRSVEIMSSPGMEAAAKWSRELTEAGAIVDVYSLEGLTCRKGGEERPVGDLNDLLLMEDAELRAAIALQLLSPAPAVPLPGESTLRLGAVRRPDPDRAAGFLPAAATPAPPPSEVRPPMEELMERNRLAEVERIHTKLTAGGNLTRSEQSAVREHRRLLAAASQSPLSGGEGNPVTAACESLKVWWVNGGGGVFQVDCGSSDAPDSPDECEWREIPQDTLLTMLQKRGISDKPVPGSLVPQTRDCLVHIMEKRVLDRAIDGLAGFRPGIHRFKSHRVLVRKGPRIIIPEEGDCPLIHDILMGALGLDGVDGSAAMVQYERILYWMIRAAGNIQQPGPVHLHNQILIMAGPAGAGKSLIQHLIITALLGGRSADPSRYIFGESSFNEGWAACEHLLIEDPRPNVRTHDRLLFAQMLKALAVNEEHTLHAKGKSEFTVPNRYATSLTINDDPDSIRILPKLTPDFVEKILLLRVRPFRMPMPCGTAQEKAALRDAIEAEMPKFLNQLLRMEVPEHLRDPHRRFNVAHYVNPDLALLLSDDTPEHELLALLDHAVIRPESTVDRDRALWEMPDHSFHAQGYLDLHPRLSARAPLRFLTLCAESGKRVWIGTAQDLCDTMERCASARGWKKVVEHNQISRLLSRLEQDLPDRVCAYRQPASGARPAARLWIIAAPCAQGPEAME